MDKETREIRRAQWIQVIKDCNSRDPKITKKEWCEANNITERQLYYWQRCFRKEVAGLLPAAAAGAIVPDQTPHHDFADITPMLDGASSNHSESNTPVLPELMIQMGEMRIFVNGTVRERTLTTVLKAIRRA